jgi:hypothetical protein
VAQVVSRQLLTTETRNQSQDISRAIFDGQNVTGAGYLQMLRFLLPIIFPPTLNSFIHHPGLAQWVHLGPKYQVTQSHPATKIQQEFLLLAMEGIFVFTTASNPIVRQTPFHIKQYWRAVSRG